MTTPATTPPKPTLDLTPARSTWFQTLIQHDKKTHKAPDRSRVLESWLRIYGGEILSLRNTYTHSRDQLDFTLLQHARSCFAYMLGFHLPNFSRAYRFLERVERGAAISTYLKEHPCHIYDIGSGTGAFAQGFQTIFPNTHPIHVVEPNKHLLKLAVDLLRNTPGIAPSAVQPIQCRAHEIRMPNHTEETSLFLLGNVLNQIQNPRKKYLQFLDKLGEQVARNSIIFIMEPATEAPSTEMMQVRNQLVAKGFIPLYPCPHTQTCPLTGTRDRCYSDFPLLPIPEMHWLDAQLGIKRHVFSASAYCLASPSVAARLQRKTPMPTLVGKPVVQDKKVALLCTPVGTIERKACDTSKKMRGEVFFTPLTPKPDKPRPKP